MKRKTVVPLLVLLSCLCLCISPCSADLGDPISSIAQALQLPDGSLINLAPKPVTSVSDYWFYLHDQDGVASIRVVSSMQFPPVGSEVQVIGIMGTNFEAERYIHANIITLVPEPGSLLAILTGLAGVGGLALRRRTA